MKPRLLALFSASGSAGLDFGHVLLFHQDTAGLPGAAEAYDRFGSELAFRDFNRDRRAELAIAADSENGGDGAVHVLRAILSSGLTGVGSVMFGPGTLGLPRLAGVGETMDG
ncbi:FG-GAP repeat protein [Flindersiella endophytica]